MKPSFGNPFRDLMLCRAVAGMAMLAALLLALVPAGFMPSVGADGKVAIVICSGMGEKTVLVDAADAPPGHEKPEAQPACPFMVMQAPYVVVVNVPVVVPSLIVSFDAPLPGLTVVAGLSHLPPPARGPPVLLPV